MKQYKSAEKALFRGQTDREDFYIETDNSVLPPIGSRVRRGPDWHWGNQDNSGLGTVVGHNPGGIRYLITLLNHASVASILSDYGDFLNIFQG